MSLAPSCPHTVLLIEDDMRLRDQIAAFLEDNGYPTMGVENVEDGTSALVTMERPCLVLIDPLTSPPDWELLFQALTPHDRVATLPMVLMAVSAPGLLTRPAVVKRPVDFGIVFRIAREHCCGGASEPPTPQGTRLPRAGHT